MNRISPGFSLLELTIVLFLCGAISMFGLLSLSRAKSSGEVKRVALELLQVIEASAEVGRNMNVVVDISYDREQHRINVASDLNRPSFLKQSIRLPQRISVQTARFANPAKDNVVLTLRPTGTATPGRFVLTDPENRHCEIIQALRGLRTLKC